MDVKKTWHHILVKPSDTVLFAIDKLNKGAWRIVLVADENRRLLGVVTDGDIRRHLLQQKSLEMTVDQVMQKHPITASIADNRDQLFMKMHAAGILHLPILDHQQRIVNLETLEGLFAKTIRDNWVIMMAGGLGKRLHPLTLDYPKPLLKIGDKPISQILLEKFIQFGFRKFYFSVNYKSDMIREYYGSGAQWGVEIQYIEESGVLGTAGSLSLLKETPTQPFFVVNADILTNINFGYVLDFHCDQPLKAQATLCVKPYQEVIPFGVVTVGEDNQLIGIHEKPSRNYFVNAGIYILEPAILQSLSFNTYCDMPHFLTQLVHRGLRVATFPIREYWLDIGQHENLAKALTDYEAVFI